ncbi:MAG: amidohydrolase family protein [Deltaproteobacteria bacterium]|nr:amidohydrolase family protein [Deltaproteobacteria bacterium]
MRSNRVLVCGLSLLPLLASCASTKPVPATASTSAPAPEARTVKRSFIASGQPIGSSVTTIAADGTITNVVDIHDNGRGPHADVTLRLAADGTPSFLEARGHTELNVPVDEHFSLEGGRGVWKSLEEHGEQALSGPAFFYSNTAADVDWLLLAALQKNGGALQLLPGGVARLEKVGDATVPLAGHDTHLVAYAITGLFFAPLYVWAREDGTFFAEVQPGFWFGEEGAESALDTLVKRQEELRHARDLAVATRLARHAPAAGFALTHARVLDVEKGEWLADQTVLVAGDTIRAVGPSASVKVPGGAEVIDLAGKALLPGLWDMHAHLQPTDGPLNIASGVTTARDVGNRSDQLDDLKQHFDDGTAIGPHVYRAGFIEGRGADAAHSEITATTPEEAKTAVEFFHKRGYDMIKIYNSMKPELVPLLAQEAHAKGMGVTGHIPMHMLANEAVRAGYDGIEHINQLMLNFFADHDTETRTPLRFSLVGEKAAGFDAHSPKAKEFYALLREHHTVFDPTYVTFEQVYVFEQGKVPESWAATLKRMPVQIQRQFVTGGLPLDGGKKELYARSWEAMLRMSKVLSDEGVTLVAGTDFTAGLALHRELELFVQGGLTPLQALRAATITPATAMKASAKSGTIAAGKLADLVVIDGDPLARIADVRRTVLTLRGGVMYASKDVYETVGVSGW